MSSKREIVHLAEPSTRMGEVPCSNRMHIDLVLVLTKFHRRFKIIIVCFIQKTKLTMKDIQDIGVC